MYIGIDLGGTNIAAGVVDESGKIIYKSSVPTLAQRPIEEIVEDMADLCVDIVDGANCSIADIKAVREQLIIKVELLLIHVILK